MAGTILGTESACCTLVGINITWVQAYLGLECARFAIKCEKIGVA